ncbi:MAG: cell wall metabolism sensor histidine kinase WalK [Anaerolineae bacterium]|nr:cell wall metabolism sensor histidine kinase WalK [Anaerolineae bacterium]
MPPLLVHPDNMFPALLNLLNNALQFYASRRACFSDRLPTGPRLIIEVADKGMGIFGDALPHIFERFFRADVARSIQTGGAEVGLSLAKRVVERHRGELEASSMPGVKTVFQIRRPLHQP